MDQRLSSEAPKTSDDSRIQFKLDEAWDSRWSTQIEAVIRQFPDLRLELGLPLFGVSSEQAEAEWKAKPRNARQAIQEADAILLSSSLYRARGMLDPATDLIAKATEILNAGGVQGSFRLHFERGITAYVRGDYLNATEDFFSAARLAGEPLYRLIALTNALFCLENLGVDYRGTLQDVEPLRGMAPASHAVHRANENSLRAFRMRQAFRQGDVSGALAEVPSPNLETIDQSAYYALWIQNLPYHAGTKRLSKTQAAQLLGSPQSFFQKGYRVRTLLGHTHADDQGFIKLSDRIDRLYLWTWNWLADPETTGSDRLMTAVNEVIGRVDLSKMSIEDQFLLRNALGWLGLADPSFSDKVRAILRKVISVSGSGFALFDAEWAVIQFLTATVEGRKVVVRDTLKYLKRNPVLANGSLYLNQMVQTLAGRKRGPLTSVAERILTRTQLGSSTKNSRITVDLNTFVISDLGAGRKIVSQPLASAVRLFKEKGAVTCEQLAREAFGLYSYDSFVHSAKIFNLVSRLRALCRNQVTFRVKSGSVVSEGNWKFAQVVEPSLLSTQLRGEMVALNLVPAQTAGTTVRKNLVTAKLFRSFHSSESFSREEAQKVLGTSKSSVTRLLERLENSRKLVRDGQGRSTRYRFSAQEVKISL